MLCSSYKIFVFSLYCVQCRTLPRITSQVQIKQHPDITIPFPATIPTNGRHACEFEYGQQLSTVQTSVSSKTNQSPSPKIMLTSHLSAEDNTLTEDDGQGLVPVDTDGQQTVKCNPRVDTLAKKQLTRSMAIDRPDSSGGKYHTYIHVMSYGIYSRISAYGLPP